MSDFLEVECGTLQKQEIQHLVDIEASLNDTVMHTWASHMCIAKRLECSEVQTAALVMRAKACFAQVRSALDKNTRGLEVRCWGCLVGGRVSGVGFLGQ